MTDYFDDYFFTTNQTGQVCPGFSTFQCAHKGGACARDPNTGKRYCCDFADVCWTITSTCTTDGSTIDCGDGTNTWCCLNGREECTQSSGQINICWSTAHDTLTNISSNALNSAYSSLASASPSASSYTFDPLVLIAATATTSSSTSKSTGGSSSITSTASSTSSASASASATSSPSSSLSGGAIAGIVIAAIATLALLAAGFYFFARRRKQKNAPHAGGLYEADAKVYPGELDGAQPPPQELASNDKRQELPAGYTKLPATEPQELPANSE